MYWAQAFHGDQTVALLDEKTLCHHTEVAWAVFSLEYCYYQSKQYQQ